MTEDLATDDQDRGDGDGLAPGRPHRSRTGAPLPISTGISRHARRRCDRDSTDKMACPGTWEISGRDCAAADIRQTWRAVETRC